MNEIGMFCLCILTGAAIGLLVAIGVSPGSEAFNKACKNHKGVANVVIMEGAVICRDGTAVDY